MLDKRVRSDGIGSISFGGPVTGEWRWGKGNPPRCPTVDDIDSVIPGRGVNSQWMIFATLGGNLEESNRETEP